MNQHKTVLLSETINGLPLQADSLYVDATLGGGGHSLQLVKKLQQTGLTNTQLLTLDLDPSAWQYFKIGLLKAGFKLNDQAGLTISKGSWQLTAGFAQANFAKLKQVVVNWQQSRPNLPCLGIIADLGLSQNQLLSSTGFSYKQEQQLDMRYDRNLQVTAADLLNGLGKKELVKLFANYADLDYALKLAEQVIDTRESKPLQTTSELNNLAAAVIEQHSRSQNPNKELPRIYQALRIAVNLEYLNLTTLLQDGYQLLAQAGKLAVISFHSGEQKLISAFSKEQLLQRRHQLIKPSRQEIQTNPRSASALLNLISKA